jgi:predicted nucleic acid-binding protein
MDKDQEKNRLPGATYAISDTGPLISAFQSNSFEVLAQIFAEIHISPVCHSELITHGWEQSVTAASAKLIITPLTTDEEKRAWHIAEQIAKQTDTGDKKVANHLGEAQVIILALRPEYQQEILLLDELAARSVARSLSVKLSGFPGVLLLAVQGGLITAEDLRNRLEACHRQGTHYGRRFIQEVYQMAHQSRR